MDGAFRKGGKKQVRSLPLAEITLVYSGYGVRYVCSYSYKSSAGRKKCEQLSEEDSEEQGDLNDLPAEVSRPRGQSAARREGIAPA